MTTAEILDAAADLLEPPGRWTQWAMARGKSGQVVTPRSRAAVCWCVRGALEKIDVSTVGLTEAPLALRDQVGLHVTSWNDMPERTQAEVVAALREAAQKEREKENA